MMNPYNMRSVKDLFVIKIQFCFEGKTSLRKVWTNPNKRTKNSTAIEHCIAFLIKTKSKFRESYPDFLKRSLEELSEKL